MARLSRKQKVRIGKRALTHEELINGVSIFNSARWNQRKQAVARRIQKQQTVAHYQAEQRKARGGRDNG